MHRKIERNDNCSIIFTNFKINFVMTKKEKNQCMVSAEDSFDSSDCSVFESNFEKWCNTERERLAAMGKDTTKFYALADPDINEGTILCEDYVMKFNRDEGVIDIIVNAKNSSVGGWDVFLNVPGQFASYLGDPENFLYRFSTSTSERKDFYGFEYVDDKGGFSLFPVDLTGEWIAENFDSLISSIYNINIVF